jgi:hypothetical protein
MIQHFLNILTAYWTGKLQIHYSVYSERTQYVLIQESVGTLDMEPPCTKHILAQYRGVCPQCNVSSRVSRYRLKDDQFVSRNLRGLLERGVQKIIDPEEPRGPVDPSTPPLAIETMLGYTGAVGTALWHELSRDRGKVRSCP